MLIGASTIIIIFAIAISGVLQGTSSQSFSQIITVGPVWSTDVWSCTSSDNFVVHGALRSPGPGNQIAIDITGAGTQSLYTLEPGQIETFSVGSSSGTIKITRTGPITGFLTMQTISGATAGCTPI